MATGADDLEKAFAAERSPLTRGQVEGIIQNYDARIQNQLNSINRLGRHLEFHHRGHIGSCGYEAYLEELKKAEAKKNGE